MSCHWSLVAGFEVDFGPSKELTVKFVELWYTLFSGALVSDVIAIAAIAFLVGVFANKKFFIGSSVGVFIKKVYTFGYSLFCVARKIGRSYC